MSILTFAAVALVLAGDVFAQQAPRPKESEAAVFTGCVGEGMDKGTYYVANLQRGNLDAATIAKEPNAIFALDSPGKLKPHVGRIVEIHGVVHNVKSSGKVDKEGDASMRIDAEGRRPTRIPEGTMAAAAAASGGVGSQRVTYKVKVKEVKSLGSTCK